MGSESIPLGDTGRGGDATAEYAPAASRRHAPARSPGWAGTSLRLLFGLVLGIDATLKWLPGFRATALSQLISVAAGQPPWLHGWFRFWISLQSGAPALFATIPGLTETGLALAVLLGLGRRVAYSAGALYMLLIWSVAEGFGGPYHPGATDIGTGIVYTIVFAALLTFAPPARCERLSLDRVLVRRWRWWRFLAETHAADRAPDASRTGPGIAGQALPRSRHAGPQPARPAEPARTGKPPGQRD